MGELMDGEWIQWMDGWMDGFYESELYCFFLLEQIVKVYSRVQYLGRDRV